MNKNEHIEKIAFKREYFDFLKKMSNSDKLELIDAIFSYSFEGKRKSISHAFVSKIFYMIKKDLDTYIKRRTKIASLER